MKDAGDEMYRMGIRHRFHTKKVRKLFLYISRNSCRKDKKVQQKIQSIYRTLIERTKWIVSVGSVAEKMLSKLGDLKAMAVAAELKHYLPITEKIIGQAERRVIKGEQVPSAEKVYSLFEEHTELIKRGKAGKPIEFGHKVLLVETGEKFRFIRKKVEIRTVEQDKGKTRGKKKRDASNFNHNWYSFVS
jgi:hypothetical protein